MRQSYDFKGHIQSRSLPSTTLFIDLFAMSHLTNKSTLHTFNNLLAFNSVDCKTKSAVLIEYNLSISVC